MRCKICDWEPGAPISPYHSTLALARRPEQYVDDKGETTCNCGDTGVTWVDGYYKLEDIGNMEEGTDGGED